LQRIRNLEKTWLQRAKSVFLTSEWAKHRLELTYDIPPSQTRTVGIFGVMDPPDNDVWSHGKDFYFISTDYVRKNGAVCRRAMDHVWKRHPDAKLHIIGDKPPDSDLVDNRVTYEGFFRKSNARELKEFRSHLAKACALLHPTNADTTSMITIESAFFGCPSISVNDFAIPEVFGPDLSHMCLERPVCSLALAKAMCELLADQTAYMKLRQSVRTRALTEHTVKVFMRRLHQAVRELERA
jgi:glycosyltransferase involved in cell wall biosynthesis